MSNRKFNLVFNYDLDLVKEVYPSKVDNIYMDAFCEDCDLRCFGDICTYVPRWDYSEHDKYFNLLDQLVELCNANIVILLENIPTLRFFMESGERYYNHGIRKFIVNDLYYAIALRKKFPDIQEI